MSGARFTLGQLLATPGALQLLQQHNLDGLTFIARHATGDWGDVDAHDRRANDDALRTGARLLSSYRIGAFEKLWIITEAADDDGVRVATTLLRPDEY